MQVAGRLSAGNCSFARLERRLRGDEVRTHTTDSGLELTEVRQAHLHLHLHLHLHDRLASRRTRWRARLTPPIAHVNASPRSCGSRPTTNPSRATSSNSRTGRQASRGERRYRRLLPTVARATCSRGRCRCNLHVRARDRDRAGVHRPLHSRVQLDTGHRLNRGRDSATHEQRLRVFTGSMRNFYSRRCDTVHDAYCDRAPFRPTRPRTFKSGE